MVSSSYDWSLKVWNSKDHTFRLTLESAEDYVFDTAFNPVHPYVLASVDGEGYLDIWSLDNISEPKAHYLTSKSNFF